ncbi:polyprenyl synthetase family protein [Streptomyces sp. G45]|uniref:polyprenyl synthetase family protein n=1 Tax=Streptomyces sp. G45 TaxID=3406627 RepID=UPI003C1BDC69
MSDTAHGPCLEHPLGADAVRQAVEAHLRSLLARAHAVPSELLDVMGGYLFSGGKRLRPLLCVAGWRAAGGQGLPETLTRVAAALEMFHAFALLHDDVMDDSALRRGRPTAHRALAAVHRGRPDADRLGVCGAILLGDMALVWSDHMLRSAGLPSRQLHAAGRVMDTMREATMCGQYLDLLSAGTGSTDRRRAMAIARDKTAKYTVEGPLHLGAVLAGAEAAVLKRLSAFALPLGDAFQLRNDLQGVFGDPGTTGKSGLDDLRDGKCTLLTALALARAGPAQRGRLLELLGNRRLNDEQAAEARQLLKATGARRLVEDRIHALRAAALAAVDPAVFAPEVAAELRGWAELLTRP